MGRSGPAYGIFPTLKRPDGRWRRHGDGVDLALDKAYSSSVNRELLRTTCARCTIIAGCEDQEADP